MVGPDISDGVAIPLPTSQPMLMPMPMPIPGCTDPVPEPPQSSREPSPTVQLCAEAALPRAESHGPEQSGLQSQPSSLRDYYTSARWTADGTSLVVTSALNFISSFVLPDDLLDSSSWPRQLSSPSRIALPEPSQAVAPAPYYSLASPTTQVLLAGCRDHPLQLYQLFPPPASSSTDGQTSLPIASYRLIRRETEEYITPSSIVWPAPGSHFVCGSTNRIDYFDISRPGSDGPLLTIPTIPSRRHISKGSGVGMKGTVAALCPSPPDANGGSLLAAGTWTRWLGLYDLHRSDKAVANWCVSQPSSAAGSRSNTSGRGIVQVQWSPCGQYLVVNERHSTGILVYDIRSTGQLLAVLEGRKATTQQKLTLDVFQGTSDGLSSTFEVWAGAQDGAVTVWEGVGSKDLGGGALQPSWSWNAHDSPVGSTVLHSSGSVVATCSGGWGSPSMAEVDQGFGTGGLPAGSQSVFDESSIRLWSIGSS